MAKITECQRCPLHESRTCVVVGRGSQDAAVVFIGEAPGKNEDLKGRPFVGQAGKNFDKVIERLGLYDDQWYVSNILKCRPPDNRKPLSSEVEACLPWLYLQLKKVEPRIVVLMGGVALDAVLGFKGITKYRGQAFYEGKVVYFAMYHPAALIYDKKKQDVFKDDLITLRSLLYKLGIVRKKR